MTKELNNYEDVIDSRDVIERIEELESIGERSPEECEELKTLTDLQKQCEGYAADWKHGELLIRESYFTEYCQQMLEDCGDLPANLPRYIHIDWERTARDLQVDYTQVEFDGVTYFIR